MSGEVIVGPGGTRVAGPSATELTLNFTNSPRLGGTIAFSQSLSVWSWSDYSTEIHAVYPPAGPFTVSLGGREYLADTSFEPYRRDAFRHRSIPTQREGIQMTNTPGEGSVNPKGLWRRGMEDWSRGAGQIYLDRKLSVDNRFYSSYGIDPWTQWQVQLLHDVKQAIRSGSPILPDGGAPTYQGALKAIACANYVYIMTASTLRWTTDWTNYTTVTGATGTYTDICSTGTTVYIATNGGGIWQTTAGASTATQLVNNLNWNIIEWVNQRIMCASGPSIYNITSSTLAAAPAPLYTHPDPNWQWIDFTYGSSQIYCAGGHYPTGPASIFRTTATSDGATLTPPVQALPLELGEFPGCLASYLNYVFVGTTKGIRMCETLAAYDPTGNQGDLRAGALIPNITQPVTAAVTGIVGNGRFVWFSWNNYTDGYANWTGAPMTGLGRLDLENFIDALTPTYASDLMIPGTRGNILLDWDPITNGPLMSVPGVGGVVTGGIWTQDPVSYVQSGRVESGYIVYDLPDDKVAMELLAEAEPPLSGAIHSYLSVDQPLATNPTLVGYSAIPLPANMDWPLSQVRGKKFQVAFELNSTPDEDLDADRDATPVLGRWTLKSYAAISTGIEISVVLVMTREVVERDLLRPFDPYAEYEYIEGLRQEQQVVQYIEGPFMRNCLITSLDWLPNLQQVGGPYSGYNSYLIVYLESLPN
jgi:hypothetical protein